MLEKKTHFWSSMINASVLTSIIALLHVKVSNICFYIIAFWIIQNCMSPLGCASGPHLGLHFAPIFHGCLRLECKYRLSGGGGGG